MVKKHDKGTLIKRVAPDLAFQTDLHFSVFITYPQLY